MSSKGYERKSRDSKGYKGMLMDIKERKGSP